MAAALSGTPDGLTLGRGSRNSTIKGLEIADFASAGIHVESSDDSIVDNMIGTDGAAADNTLGNEVGIFVDGADGGTAVTIGDTTSGTANVIGLNASAGVAIAGTGSTDDVVLGNYIGTNAGGANLGNAIGVVVGSGDNTIGGTISAPESLSAQQGRAT